MLTQFIRARRRAQRGQALVEFALIAPLLFLLLFGVIQLGLLMGQQNGLVNGVRDSARRAATYRINQDSFDTSTFAAICSTVEANLNSHLRSSIPGYSATLLSRTISYEWRSNPTASGGTPTYFLVAHVQATYSAPIYIPLVGAALPGTAGGHFNLSASEEMRVENPALTPTSTTTQTCAS